MDITLYNPLFLIPVITGLIFVILAIIMLKFPPKDINSLYGYRTKSSMQNKERWTFAQKYSAIEMAKLGGILTLSGLMGLFINPDAKTGMFIGLGLMIIMVIILLFRVESAIKKKFNNQK